MEDQYLILLVSLKIRHFQWPKGTFDSHCLTKYHQSLSEIWFALGKFEEQVIASDCLLQWFLLVRMHVSHWTKSD
jgi:hypothetical protein